MPAPPLTPALARPAPSRSVLTGSYHNYFKIYDVESGSDTLLQADKSAFKAKKIGGVKAGAKGKQGQMETTGIDFNKKIVSRPSLRLQLPGADPRGKADPHTPLASPPRSSTPAGTRERTRSPLRRPTTCSSTAQGRDLAAVAVVRSHLARRARARPHRLHVIPASPHARTCTTRALFTASLSPFLPPPLRRPTSIPSPALPFETPLHLAPKTSHRCPARFVPAHLALPVRPPLPRLRRPTSPTRSPASVLPLSPSLL